MMKNIDCMKKLIIWKFTGYYAPSWKYESKIFDGPQLFVLLLKLPKILFKKPLGLIVSVSVVATAISQRYVQSCSCFEREEEEWQTNQKSYWTKKEKWFGLLKLLARTYSALSKVCYENSLVFFLFELFSRHVYRNVNRVSCTWFKIMYTLVFILPSILMYLNKYFLLFLRTISIYIIYLHI